MADDDPAELTPEAQREIQEAIRIVREDKQYSMISALHGAMPKPTDPPKDPPKDPPAPPKPSDPPKPPEPPKDPPPPKPTDPPADPPKRRGLWWGDQISDPEEGK